MHWIRRQWRIHMAKSLGQWARGESWTRHGRGGDNTSDKKSRKKDQERGMTGIWLVWRIGLAYEAKLRQVMCEERLWKMRGNRRRDVQGICNCLSPTLKQKHRFSSLLILQSCPNSSKSTSLLHLLAHREDNTTVLLSAALLAKMTKDYAVYLTCLIMLMNHEGFW